MATTTQRFVLVGPHAGKTLTVNGHEFVDGEFTFLGSEQQVSTLTKIFGLYGAVPEQEAELETLRAQLAGAQSLAEASELSGPIGSTEQEAELETLRAQLAGAQSLAEASELSGPIGSTEPAEPPPAPTPDEQLAAALAPTLAEAIGQLDPEVDAHWTSNNLPSLEHLSGLTNTKVSRGEVEAVADGYTRAKARAARG